MDDQSKKEKRVLIVDDEASVRDLLETFLKEAGFEVFTAANSSEALEKMTQFQAHTMLLDIRLSGENGLTFLPDFKKQFPQVTVLILTGVGYDDGLIKNALKNGAVGYFSKETGLENIVPLIERFI